MKISALVMAEQWFAILRHRAIVGSARGPDGGARLAKDAAQVSVAEIIAVDELNDATPAAAGRCKKSVAADVTLKARHARNHAESRPHYSFSSILRSE